MAGEKKSIHEQMIEDMDHICPIWDQVQLAVLLALGAFLLDYFNVPSRLIDRLTLPVFGVLAVALVVLAIIQIGKRGGFSALGMGCVNQVDVFCVVSGLAMAIYGTGRYYMLGCSLIVQVVALYLIFNGACFLRRYFLVYIRLKTAREQEDRLIDLEVLHSGNFKHTPGEPVLVSERAVDYDLFGRDVVIGQLVDAITHCQSVQSYVISLEGEWGTGKSTILNCTRDKIKDEYPNQFEFIEDFDPWLYGSQEELLRGLFDTLMKHVSGRHMSLRDQNELDSLVKAVADHYSGGNILYHALRVGRSQQDMVEALKGRISAYIRAQKKQFVFFIDNLDRASKENIILLFKLISQVFDLPGVVYVLAFERERIDEIFKETKEVNHKFIEKIIQQEIKVPELPEEKKQEVYKKCAEELLSQYGVSTSDKGRYEPLIEYIVRATENVRAFIRMLNSVFPTTFLLSSETDVFDKRELLGIKLIQFFDPELYSTIKDNPDYFCKHGCYYSEIEAEKKFLEELLQKHEKSRKVLYLLFPIENIGRIGEKFESDSEVPISNRNYFDNYLSYGVDGDLKICRAVLETVKKLNQEGDEEKFERLAKDELNAKPEVWFGKLGMYIRKYYKNKDSYLLNALYQQLETVRPLKNGGMEGKIEDAIGELLYRCSENDFETFVGKLEHDCALGEYRYFRYVVGILGQLGIAMWDTDKGRERKKKIDDICQKTMQSIVEQGTNIYTSEDYQEKDMRLISHILNRINENSEIVGNYISQILGATPQYVYKVIKEAAGEEVVTSYEDRPYFPEFFGEGNAKKAVDNALKENPPQTDKEKTIKKRYDNWRSEHPTN